MLIASHYIEKDKKMRSASKVTRPLSSRSKDSSGRLDVTGLSHQEVDRFAILLDMWTQEACYLENKKLVSESQLKSFSLDLN